VAYQTLERWKRLSAVGVISNIEYESGSYVKLRGPINTVGLGLSIEKINDHRQFKARLNSNGL